MAQGLSHPHSLAFAEYYVGFHRLARGEIHAAQETAEALIALSTEHGLTDYLAWATILRGSIMAAQGRNEEGIALMQEGLDASRAAGAEAGRPYYLCELAEAFMETGRLGDGLRTLTEALVAAEEHEERVSEAEIYRLRGELLLRQEHSNAAEAQSCLQRAVEIAQNRSAKPLELRATMSLARLLAKQSRRGEARAMLAEIYNWFTEGFDTADLKNAKTLLDELNE